MYPYRLQSLAQDMYSHRLIEVTLKIELPIFVNSTRDNLIRSFFGKGEFGSRLVVKNKEL